MTITTEFDPPLPSDSPAVFNAKAFTLLGDLNTWTDEANATADQVNADAAAAAAALDSFDDRYLGAKAADPGVDNDGGALTEGALYWNTVSKRMRVYNGSAWFELASSSISTETFTGTGALNAFNLSAAPVSKSNTQIHINGVYQPKSAYTLSGTTLSFAAGAPASGAAIEVVIVSVMALGVPGDDTVTDAKVPAGAAIASEKLAFDGGTVRDVLDDAKPMQSYTALRAYTGRATGVRITTPGVAGHFYRDASDTTSADNGGTIIVDASGRRWKRLFAGAVNLKWFWAVGDGVADDTLAIQAAVNYCVAPEKPPQPA